MPAFAWLEWAGAAVWAVGVIGEATADRQLARFKARPVTSDPGLPARDSGAIRVTRTTSSSGSSGAASRLFALGSPGGWLGLHVIPMMFYVMRHGTGVPYAERSSLRSRGDAYRGLSADDQRVLPRPETRLTDAEPRYTARPQRRSRCRDSCGHSPQSRGAAEEPRPATARRRPTPRRWRGWTPCATLRSPSRPTTPTRSTTRCRPSFFELVLGPHLKYSSGYWPPGVATLGACRRRDAGA